MNNKIVIAILIAFLLGTATTGISEILNNSFDVIYVNKIESNNTPIIVNKSIKLDGPLESKIFSNNSNNYIQISDTSINTQLTTTGSNLQFQATPYFTKIFKGGLLKHQFDDNTRHLGLAGIGNAYVCVNSTGWLYRNSTGCI